MSDLQYLIPDQPEQDPEVSLVVPALNEERVIGLFVDWCKEGLSRAGVRGEILIIDSSTDRTAQIAVQHGAFVLKTPKRGLGRAYIDSLGYIRGKYVILGDCDCTYDFRELGPFIEKFRQGYELIMGSRFRGKIEDGAMPFLHRYLGTPVTTWILNRIFSSRFSDIHCGMRGITRAALLKMNLSSQSWEYASEMVLKSVRMRLKTAEVPIQFFKDRNGRVSHHKREGWFSPWKAAWINLREMFIYGADFFLVRPGVVLLVAGSLLVIPLSLGPVTIGKIEFSLYWMLLGMSLVILGLQCFYLGILARNLYDFSDQTVDSAGSWFSYNRVVFGSILIFGFGFALVSSLAIQYVQSGMKLWSIPVPAGYLAVTGLTLMIVAFMTFCFTLLFHGMRLSKELKLPRPA